MPSAIDKIRSHFDSLSKRKIEVAEWGITIHSTPLTISERSQIYRGVPDGDDHSPLVRILMVKAKDENGEPLFGKADEPHLMNHADPTVVFSVASKILSNEAPNATELGNS